MFTLKDFKVFLMKNKAKTAAKRRSTRLRHGGAVLQEIYKITAASGFYHFTIFDELWLRN